MLARILPARALQLKVRARMIVLSSSDPLSYTADNTPLSSVPTTENSIPRQSIQNRAT
jgi:hypothetical protein